ncbi:MAG TPA: tRNA (adenosine(37)-N6)-dimethylallyltransferase MiaA [bacterium]
MARSSGASSAPEPRPPLTVALVGPTASGKTAAGILLAEALGTAGVINCDSRQVYRRLDVGTAKPTAAERARVPHHLVDVADPRERFTAADYRAAAQAVVSACAAAGRAALFVGGTGLYLRAATQGLCAAPAAEPAVRRWLAALATTLPGGLHPLLARVDPAAATRIHANDRYRIVRALEVYFLTGDPLSERQRRHREAGPGAAVRTFAIELPAAELRRRIDARLDEMVAAGFVAEARSLLAEGLDPALPALRAVGYPQMFAHLRGEASLAETLAAIRRATWQYARRQLTWFRALPGIVWVPGGEDRPPEAVAEAVLSLLRRGRAA